LYKGIDGELAMSSSEKTSGAFVKFSALEKNNNFLTKQVGLWKKAGDHTFALDTRWNSGEDDGKWGFKTA